MEDSPNEEFLEEALAAPRRLVGDALAKANRRPNVDGVGDRRTLKGSNRTIAVFRLALAERPVLRVLLAGSSRITAERITMRTPVRPASGPPRCRQCGSGRLERETTIKGVSTSVKWRCTACEAVFPASKRKAV